MGLAQSGARSIKVIPKIVRLGAAPWSPLTARRFGKPSRLLRVQAVWKRLSSPDDGLATRAAFRRDARGQTATGARCVLGGEMFFEKRPMAGAAFAAFTQPFARHAVDRVAMRANDVQRVSHGVLRNRHHVEA